MMLSSVRLVTFDVTGTLMRHTGTVGEQYATVICKYFNVNRSENVLDKAFRKTYREHVKLSPLFGSNHGISAKQWWASVFYGTLLATDVIPESRLKYVYHQRIERPFLALDSKPSSRTSQLDKAFNDIYYNFQWEALPHAHEVLKLIYDEYKVKERKIVAVGAISNNDDRISMILKNAGLAKFIDFVITSHEAGYEKPDPKIFQQAIDHANNLKNPNQSNVFIKHLLHIGDSHEKDYLGAIKCGAQALLIDNDKQQHSNGLPSHHVTDLNAVISYVKKRIN
uniref:Haloacid dehalogenase-like hydrolase domain-containing protein 3 n=1 Tax=Phallusia mammillata TaxID=59560 RepID=A0A6F9DEK6_9ASCI|nr:haloacid dehalogenase-like hydrolase domain-containing protein 3 [Phallusia mammillata]